VRPTDDRYCGHIGRICLHDGDAVQPPVREPSLEGRPATPKRAQCIFSESTLFWKILVTRVKRIQQGSYQQSDNTLLRNSYFGLLARCSNPSLLFATPIKRQPTARREHDRKLCYAIGAGDVWPQEKRG
jgi:hypothetical protein